MDEVDSLFKIPSKPGPLIPCTQQEFESDNFETPEPFSPEELTNERNKDVTYQDTLAGVDIQRIPWARFSISRNDYRKKRLREFSNYSNVPWTAQLELKRRFSISSPTDVQADFFSFFRSYGKVQPTIEHFQLRHLLVPCSPYALYYVSNSSLCEFDTFRNISRPLRPSCQSQVGCMDINADLCMACIGMFDSLVLLVPLDDSEPYKVNTTPEQHCITNAVLFMHNQLAVSNNDCWVRGFPLESLGQPAWSRKFPWPVNHMCARQQVLCVAGDNCSAQIVDLRDPSPFVAELKGHLDFLFSASWHPNGHLICTGSQDATCRVFDVRKSQELVTLGSLVGAVRATSFSSDGKYLAFAEPSDFVYVYDCSTFAKCQPLDFFGNVAGIGFSPDASKLFVSVSDAMFGCLLEFNARKEEN